MIWCPLKKGTRYEIGKIICESEMMGDAFFLNTADNNPCGKNQSSTNDDL